MMEGLTTTASHVEWWRIGHRWHILRACRWCKKEVSSSIEEVAIAEGTEESFVGEAVAVMELYSRLSWGLRERLREGTRAGGRGLCMKFWMVRA